jgi:hypothetical protein
MSFDMTNYELFKSNIIYKKAYNLSFVLSDI